MATLSCQRILIKNYLSGSFKFSLERLLVRFPLTSNRVNSIYRIEFSLKSLARPCSRLSRLVHFESQLSRFQCVAVRNELVRFANEVLAEALDSVSLDNDRNQSATESTSLQID